MLLNHSIPIKRDVAFYILLKVPNRSCYDIYKNKIYGHQHPISLLVLLAHQVVYVAWCKFHRDVYGALWCCPNCMKAACWFYYD